MTLDYFNSNITLLLHRYYWTTMYDLAVNKYEKTDDTLAKLWQLDQPEAFLQCTKLWVAHKSHLTTLAPRDISLD